MEVIKSTSDWCLIDDQFGTIIRGSYDECMEMLYLIEINSQVCEEEEIYTY
jgi:hypothetical protein